jgi:hypothetical protein
MTIGFLLKTKDEKETFLGSLLAFRLGLHRLYLCVGCGQDDISVEHFG